MAKFNPRLLRNTGKHLPNRTVLSHGILPWPCPFLAKIRPQRWIPFLFTAGWASVRYRENGTSTRRTWALDHVLQQQCCIPLLHFLALWPRSTTSLCPYEHYLAPHHTSPCSVVPFLPQNRQRRTIWRRLITITLTATQHNGIFPGAWPRLTQQHDSWIHLNFILD